MAGKGLDVVMQRADEALYVIEHGRQGVPVWSRLQS